MNIPFFSSLHSSAWSLVALFGLLFFIDFEANAQVQVPLKKDYIVVADTVLSQGDIQGFPVKKNSTIYFARFKKQGYQKYTLAEVTEFRLSERMFYAKTFLLNGERTVAFLEQLPSYSEEINLWKWNGEPNYYFVETSDGFQQLGDDYQSQLKQIFDNPDLEPLIEITRLGDFSLSYLAKTAATIEKPRTFSRTFRLTPFVGYSSQTVGFTIPDTNLDEEITGSSWAVGLNGEAFLNYKRNLSANVGALVTRFDSQRYFDYPYNGPTYQSDIYIDFTLIQFPALVRYYFDLKPNQMRLYLEAGYTYAIATNHAAGVYQAQLEDDQVVTTHRTFELQESYSGLVLGVGLEKYVHKDHGIVLGVRQFDSKSKNKDFVKGLTFHLGYKF